MVNDWLYSAKEPFEEKADVLKLEARLKLPGSDPAERADNLKDSVDIIRM